MSLILGFSLPLLVGMLFQQFYSLVDTIIVGKFLGVDALAAVGSTGAINFLIIGFCMGVCSGFAIPVAQRFGAGDYESLRKYVANSVWLCLIFSAVMTLIVSVFCRQILELMQTPSNIIDQAYSYIFIIFVGIPVTYLYNITSGIMRSLGDSKTPVYFLLLASGINIVLDLIFITQIGMGVEGAGYATVISQFISGMLFALPLLPDGSRLVVEGARESASYLQLTLRALATFGLTPREQEEGWTIASQGYASPGVVQVEGDWSNAAPWLCLGMLGGEGVTVTGMDLDSLQGDRAVCRVLAAMGGQVRTAADRVTVLPGPRVPTRMDARDIPDLVPVLAAVAAATPGVTEITGAARLRLKESDRLETTARMLNGLGGQVEETADGLLIRGRSHLSGGQVDAAGDHRIAMAAAVASGACTGPVTITGAQAVEKSYPTFWAELRSLGKQVEETPVGP